MKGRTNKRFLSALGAVARPLILIAALASICAAQESGEPAQRSRLTGIELPANAERVTDKNALSQLIGHLNELFNERKPQEPEVIGWDTTKGYTPANANRFIEQIAQSLQKAGYTYQLKEVGAENGTTVKVISAVRGEDGQTVLGLWYVMPEGLILAWAKTLVVPDPPVSAMRGAKLADGHPPLTSGLVDAFAVALARTLGVPTNDTIKPKLQEMLTTIWREQDEASINTIVRMLIQDDVAEQKGIDKELAHLFVRTLLVKEAYQPNRSDAAQILKELYYAAHPPIATSPSGARPLTKDAQQAFVETVAFALKEMPDGVSQLQNDEREWLADWALELYRNGKAENQEAMSELELSWAGVQIKWRTASEAERNNYRQQFVQNFADVARQIKLHRVTIQSYQVVNAEAARLNELREQNALKPTDIERMAQAEEATAKALRAEGGEHNLAVAEQFEGFAKQMRSQASDLRQPIKAPDRPVISRSDCVGACAQRKLRLLAESRSYAQFGF